MYHGAVGEEEARHEHNDEIEQVPQHVRHEERLEPPDELLDVEIDGEGARLEEEIARNEEEERIGDGGYALGYDVDDTAGHSQVGPLIADGSVVAVTEQNHHDEREPDECDNL